MDNQKRNSTTDYEFYELPSLPDGWEWEKCELDGDPLAVRKLRSGVTETVHANSSPPDGLLSISVNRDSDNAKQWDANDRVERDPSLHGHPPCRIYSFRFIDPLVFAAVKDAIDWWKSEMFEYVGE